MTSHSDTISGLLSCTQYFFDVISIDASGNSATSSIQSLITAGCVSNATVVNGTVGSITVSGGGTVSLVSASESAVLTIPEDVSSTAASLIIQSKKISGNIVLGAQTAPDQFTGIATHVYDFKAYTDLDTVVTIFDEPITITLTYSDDSIFLIDENTLRIYRFTGTEWVLLDNCTVDRTLNRVSCTTTHFSVFALFGIASPTPTTSSNTIVSAGSVARSGFSPHETPSAILARSKTPSTQSTGNARTPTVSLREKTTHSEVKILQQALNALGYPVATGGAGSPGKETELFGPATKQAVIKWQKAHGVIPASGFFGPLSRQKMKSILGK